MNPSLRRISSIQQLTLLTAMACCALGGCGGAPDGKCLVAGEVTWNGQPLEKGRITLFPISGEFGGEEGEIVAGRFKFYARPGKNRVQITAVKDIGYSESMRQQISKQYLPAEYHSESKLSQDIPKEGDEKLEFKLTGKEQ
jgi:hypothetical protein